MSIIAAIGTELAQVLLKLLSVAREVLKYLNWRREDAERERKEAEAKAYNERLRDACDNGTVEDLIDL